MASSYALIYCGVFCFLHIYRSDEGRRTLLASTRKEGVRSLVSISMNCSIPHVHINFKDDDANTLSFASFCIAYDLPEF